MSNFSPIEFKESKLLLLDQRKLPLRELFVECESLEDTYKAISEMVVRGAPCIGFTAIYGLALWCLKNEYSEESFNKACDYLISARPTAVNLEFEVRVAQKEVNNLTDKKLAFDYLVKKAQREIKSSGQKNLLMAKAAAKELCKLFGERKLKILTHCNTGFLACGSIGTALGVIEHLHSLGRIESVWVDETRPYLQGSRLTSFELSKLGIPHHIVVEGAASYLMEKKLVDAIFVGADRVVKNGDTANKVGTANLSIISKYFEVPMYVVAPLSSFDLQSNSKESIEIELRDEGEVLKVMGHQIAPIGAKAYNPSFDLTRGENLTGIICEKGMFKSPYIESLKELM